MKKFFIYKETNEQRLYAYEYRLDSLNVIEEKSLFMGKKAKLEAIYRMMGVRLREDMTSADVNKWLTEYFYQSKKDWKDYRSTLAEVCSEKIEQEKNYSYLNTIEVMLDGEAEYSKRQLVDRIIASYCDNKCYEPIMKMEIYI